MKPVADDPGSFSTWIPLSIFLVVFVSYLLTVGGCEIFDPVTFQSYVAQADAFLNGNLHLEHYPPQGELAHYAGKAYVAAPPAPSIVLLPLVRVFGVRFNPLMLHIFMSSATVALMFIVFRKRGASQWTALILALALAFGTVLWWCSKQSTHWFTAHVMSVFFLSLALWLVHARQTPGTVGFLIAISALCRQLTFFSFPFFLYRLIRGSGITDTRAQMHNLWRFFTGLTIPIIAYLAFNYARFENIFEGGYAYLYLRSPGLERFAQHGLFSFHYLPENLYTILFAAPRLSPQFPFLTPVVWGQAIVFTSPFLLYAFRSRLRRPENVVLWTCILLMLGPQLLYFNNGYAQFGYRFALDFLPLLMLLTLEGLPLKLTKGVVTVVGLSILFNLVGVYTL